MGGAFAINSTAFAADWTSRAARCSSLHTLTGGVRWVSAPFSLSLIHFGPGHYRPAPIMQHAIAISQQRQQKQSAPAGPTAATSEASRFVSSRTSRASSSVPFEFEAGRRARSVGGAYTLCLYTLISQSRPAFLPRGRPARPDSLIIISRTPLTHSRVRSEWLG